MKRSSLLIALISAISFSIFAQEREGDIINIIDNLRFEWDDEAINLESFEGMEKYCHEKKYRKGVIELLNTIHHYDTTLYFVVTAKYDKSKNAQAKETLDDILIVESKYTTPNFLNFLSQECVKVKTVERHQRSSHHDSADEIEDLEKELIQYIEAVTTKIDLVDEHIHHLKEL
ncbi:MAG: hypothetical protein ACJA2S_000787 [Cyclobacteriaceae bacterium]|jgi:hypothetical protein